jgi:hypothetical protein
MTTAISYPPSDNSIVSYFVATVLVRKEVTPENRTIFKDFAQDSPRPGDEPSRLQGSAGEILI